MLRTVLLSMGFALLVGCGSPKVCTPQTCATGCCSSSGECVSGGENSACGANGNACVNCSESLQICANSACAQLPGSTGGGTTATGGGGGSGGGGTTGGGGGTTGGGGGTMACTASPVECSDQAIQRLGLFTTVAPGEITNGSDATGFKATIDATAGGSSPTQSYVYARFGELGLEKVAISDEQSLASMDWDIAFRRFIIRVNSGDSGPSCVAGQSVSGSYDSVTAVPANFLPEADDFLTRPPQCEFVADGSGLTTSPRTLLAPFYRYTTCIFLTDKVFVLKTRTGRHVKLTVTGYYATEAAQAACQAGTPGMSPGGTIRLRWMYLD